MESEQPSHTERSLPCDDAAAGLSSQNSIQHRDPYDKWSPAVLLMLYGTLHKHNTDLSTYCIARSVRTSSYVILKAPVLTGPVGFNQELLDMLKKRVREKFKLNYQFCRKTKYHCIVQTEYTFRKFGSHILASKYCRDGTLFDWLLRGPRLEKIYVYQICLAVQHVCIALRFLHRHNCYLRDVGFNNILFPNGDPRSVKLSLDSSVSSELLKLCGTNAVNLAFCPPEIIRPIMDLNNSTNHKDGDCRSEDTLKALDGITAPTAAANMWSVGVVAHALLTGKLPFRCGINSLESKREYIKHHPYPSMERDFMIYPRCLRNRIDGFLHPNASKRTTAFSGANSLWFDCEEIRCDDSNMSYRYEEGYFWIEQQFQRETTDLINKIRSQDNSYYHVL